MEAPSSINQYPVKLENDQMMDSLASVPGGPGSLYHHPLLTQSHLYGGGWNPQPQFQQHSLISEYPYAYGQHPNYATFTQQRYADVDMYDQTSPTTTDTSLRTSAGNPVSVPVTLSAPLNSLGYPNFNGSSSTNASAQQQQSQQHSQQQQSQQQQQQHNGSQQHNAGGGGGGGISRPPSVVHSPMNEAFSSRARSTSYPGPYYLPPSMHPKTFSSVPPPSGFPHPLARMSQLTAVVAETTNNQVKQGNSYYNMAGSGNGSGNGMTSPTLLESSAASTSTPYDSYIQEDQSPTTSMGMSNGNPHNQYRPAPGSGSVQAQQQGMYSYITPPPSHQHQNQAQHQQRQNHHQNQQQHQALPPPTPSLASSITTGGAPTISRGMSMGNIPGNGTLNPNTFWFSGRTTPSGIITPGATLNPPPSVAASALSRSTASRLGIGPPSLTIPSNFLATSEYDMYSASGSGAGGMSGAVLSSLIGGGIGGLVGGGSRPGTTSNGGSVPLTPTTEDAAPFDHNHHITPISGSEDEEVPSPISGVIASMRAHPGDTWSERGTPGGPEMQGSPDYVMDEPLQRALARSLTGSGRTGPDNDNGDGDSVASENREKSTSGIPDSSQPHRPEPGFKPGRGMSAEEDGGNGGTDDQMELPSTSRAEPIPSLEILMMNHTPLNLSGQVIIPDHANPAHGGLANVHAGLWNNTMVAVKVLRIRKSRRVDANLEASNERRIAREMNVWAALKHPNITEFLGYSTDFSDYPAMISMWCKRGTASEYLDQQQRPVNERVRLAQDVSDGLEYLHLLKIVHGDLKPSNVLVDNACVARLCDFGLVRLVDWEGPAGMTTTSPYTGTERYKAPELFISADNRHPVATFEGDIYSLGCIILEFIEQVYPFQRFRRNYELRNAIMDGYSPALRSEATDSLLGRTNALWDLLEVCWDEPLGRPIVSVIVEALGSLAR